MPSKTGAPTTSPSSWAGRCRRPEDRQGGGCAAPRRSVRASSFDGDPSGFHGTERFQIERRLGSGGMGVVYQALDRVRNEVVALKTLRWTDASTIYRFKREFRTLLGIVHPNLVGLYELFGEGDEWYFTMELVKGSQFLEFVRPDVLSVERLRPVLAQLATGLVALHRAGMLHRDLKPSNVILTPEGRPVILDFGIAADMASSGDPLRTAEDGIWGTAEYMSPEQGRGEATAASDWYAVGCMLYEALTGRLPFAGSAAPPSWRSSSARSGSRGAVVPCSRSCAGRRGSGKRPSCGGSSTSWWARSAPCCCRVAATCGSQCRIRAWTA